MIEFVRKMLKERLAEVIWESSLLGLAGEVPLTFTLRALELRQPSSFQHVVDAAVRRARPQISRKWPLSQWPFQSVYAEAYPHLGPPVT